MNTFKKIGLVLLTLIIAGLVYYNFPEKQLPTNAKITRIVVNKSERKMMVYEGVKLLNTYTVALGKSPIGDKQKEGDNKTPEGNYNITRKYGLGVCGYHKGLYINYPTPAQTAQGKEGGDILIHGQDPKYSFTGKFHRWKDWTAGCIAVTDEEIDDIYDRVIIGCPVTINP
jgi:murein L,D-transpeptidase YafK